MVKVPKIKPALDFRRSVTKDKISTPMAMPTKPPTSILPPKKVIKALYDYDSDAPHELSFSKGDFFHVIDSESDPNWYHACNPATNSRGLVPVSYFQVLEKSSRLSATSDKIELGTFNQTAPPASVGGISGKQQPLYGTVLYDFIAERQDELNATAGDNIVVIAQSNHEWFVAKPIDRIGGPGLIPVTFVEIKDLSTGKRIDNVQELMDRSIVPKVEDWKKMTQDYQEKSIALGRLDASQDDGKPTEPKLDPKLQPFALDPKLVPAGSPGYESGADPNLGSVAYGYNEDGDGANSRSFNDDNDVGGPSAVLQDGGVARSEAAEITEASVEAFEFEADCYWFLLRLAMTNGQYRLLYRRYEDFYDFQINLLNEFPAEAGRTGDRRTLPFMPGPLSYVNDMITAQRRNDLDVYVKELLQLPEYILQHPLLDQLFGIRNGDYELQYDPRENGMIGGVKNTDTSPVDPLPPATSFSSMHDSAVGSSVSSMGNSPFGGRGPLSYGNSSSSNNNGTPRYTNNGYKSSTTSTSSTSSRFAQQQVRHKSSGTFAQQTTADGKPAFLKIKIQDNRQNDLIAVRVPPDITFAGLREKVHERLGNHITVLRYNDEESGRMENLRNDADLRHALRTCQRLVVHAD